MLQNVPTTIDNNIRLERSSHGTFAQETASFVISFVAQRTVLEAAFDTGTTTGLYC